MVAIKNILLAMLAPVLVFSAPAAQQTPAPTADAPTRRWVHPGYVIDRSQLDFVKAQVAIGAQPWIDAYNQMLKDSDQYGLYATGTSGRTSTPTSDVGCGPTTTPDYGCTDERGDALAAWANALAWYVSGNINYAKNAIGIMNKWSYVIQTHTLSNAILQTSWAGASWARAGELIRHTTSQLWAEKDVAQFGNMLKNVYLPACKDGDTLASNWDVSCLNTAIGISVFNEDADAYDHAMALFQETVPSVIYLDSDGALPYPARGLNGSASALQSRWYGQQTWGNPGQSGQIQETCRDKTHTGYSISSISHVLETSRIQGFDQYTGDLGTRLHYALEFHTAFGDGEPQPSWLCEGKNLTRDLSSVTEIGYNALGNRLHNDMPQTLEYTERIRPQGTNGLFYGWETLTHAENFA